MIKLLVNKKTGTIDHKIMTGKKVSMGLTSTAIVGVGSLKHGSTTHKIVEVEKLPSPLILGKTKLKDQKSSEK